MIFSKATPMCSTKHYARQYIKKEDHVISHCYIRHALLHVAYAPHDAIQGVVTPSTCGSP